MIESLLLTGAVVLTVGAWVAAARLGRLTDMPVRPGLRNGATIALLIGLIVVAVVTLYMNGREFLGGPIGLVDAFTLGLLVGVPVAVGFFWLGALLMPLGLLVRLGRRWTTAGVWIAVPLAAVLIYAAYVGYQTATGADQAPNSPTPAPAASSR
jgi:hypothetical protein